MHACREIKNEIFYRYKREYDPFFGWDIEERLHE